MAHWAMWKRRQSSTNCLARYQAWRKNFLKKSLCNVLDKARIDLMANTAVEAAAETLDEKLSDVHNKALIA